MPDWHVHTKALGQLENVHKRKNNWEFSDDEVFESVLLAILFNAIDWAKIQNIRCKLKTTFCGFSLKRYADLLPV